MRRREYGQPPPQRPAATNVARPSEGKRVELSPIEIFRIAQDPAIRWAEVPGGMALLNSLLATPSDAHLQALLLQKIEEQKAKAALSGNPFYENNPTPGSIPPPGMDCLLPIQLPTGSMAAITDSSLRSNVLCVGPTGAGKTTVVRGTLACALARTKRRACDVRFIGFDRKADMLDRAYFSQPDLPLRELLASDLRFNPLQPPEGVSVAHHLALFVDIIARHCRLEASRRLIFDCAHKLFDRPRRHGVWPCMSELISQLESERATAFSKSGQYKETAVFALKSLAYSFGDSIECASSDLFARVLAEPGVTVIRADALRVEAASLLAALFIYHAYETRANASAQHGDTICFVLDDALPLVSGGSQFESEGSTNPLAQWLFMGRSRGIGFLVSAQNYAAVSPIIRNNVSTVLAAGAYGADARELSRDLHLTRAQAEILPTIANSAGLALVCARPIWGLPVLAKIPEVVK